MGPARVIVLTGFWALLRRTEGAERAVRAADSPRSGRGSGCRGCGTGRRSRLPWLHTRLRVLAATLGGLILVRLAHVPNPSAKATAFLAVPAAGALAWMGFFLVVYGIADPTAPYGGDVGSLARVSSRTASAACCSTRASASSRRRRSSPSAFIGFARERRLAVEWLVVASLPARRRAYAMWWAGSSCSSSSSRVSSLPPLRHVVGGAGARLRVCEPASSRSLLFRAR